MQHQIWTKKEFFNLEFRRIIIMHFKTYKKYFFISISINIAIQELDFIMCMVIFL